MFISIVEKNGVKIPSDTLALDIFIDEAQFDRYYDWIWEAIPFTEAKARVEKLGYTINDPTPPESVGRFRIWRWVNPNKRKPELVEFEGMMLKLKIS